MSEITWMKAKSKPRIVLVRNPLPLEDLPYEAVRTINGIIFAYPEKDCIVKDVDNNYQVINKILFNKTFILIDLPNKQVINS